MSKHSTSKRKLKYVFLALTCTAAFSLSGIAATACKPQDEPEENDKKTTREDTQLLKNGNFEFYDVPEKEKDGNEPVYLINTPNSWTHGGATSNAMSGIINTNKTAWDLMAADDLADKLDANNELDKDDSNYKELYVDYNGMKSSDILYRDTYAALNPSKVDEPETYFGLVRENDRYYYNGAEVFYETADNNIKTFYFDEDLTKPLTKERIANPGTHYNFDREGNGYYYTDDNGEKVTVYRDDNGDYFLNYDEKTGEYSGTFTNVLMLHNYSNSAHNGIAQNYSSVSVNLPANTAAEISVWVKTADLFYHGGEKVTQDKGAYISVAHTVGSTALDDFTISCINTEKLLGGEQGDYNGWVQYTVYVRACDFASSSITLKLGLGGDNNVVEGYAFFDDLKVTQYANLNDSSYADHEDEIKDTVYPDISGAERHAYTTLLSDSSEKIFCADAYRRNGEVISERFSDCNRFFLDLASGGSYDKFNFANGSLTSKLTVDDNDYVSSKDNSFAENKIGNIAIDGAGKVKLPDALKSLNDNAGLDTSSDLVALVRAGHTFTAAETPYYERLNTALSTAAGLSGADRDSSLLVTLSARGAAYTTSFEIPVSKGEHKIISFWLKTSDMEGGTAATVKLTDTKNDDATTSLTLDTTGVATDIDKDNPDIYKGWVQCFFFVNNEDDENAKTVRFDFCFGNTDLGSTTISSYKAGFAAIADLQCLNDVEPDTYKLTSTGDHAAELTLPESAEKNTTAFAEVIGNSSNLIKSNIVAPSTYEGWNGGSSKIVNNGKISTPFDSVNTSKSAGLINREYADNYYNSTTSNWYKNIMDAFAVRPGDLDANGTDASTALLAWYKVFDYKTYQPLIIMNNLRKYAENATANKDNYTDYYIEAEDDFTGDKVVTENGKAYRKATSGDDFDEETKYYTIKEVMNYGYIASSDANIASNSYQAVSVRVKVSAGAVAYVHLADTASGNDILGFGTPSYSFRYDEDGNVLKGEIDADATLAQRKENILYSLRSDGLYEDKDGKLYANTWNYTKLYKDESASYFDASGKGVNFEDLKAGETYYADSTHSESKLANHFLVNDANIKIFEYKDGNYYYIVEGKTQDKVVYPFDRSAARYTDISEKYTAVVDARYDEKGNLFSDPACTGNIGYDKDGNLVAGEWVTVTFVIHTGSEAKNYRLELWSGSRESTGVDGTTYESKEGSVVVFDYSYTTVSDDTLKTEYENEIIKAYQSLLISKGITNFASSAENISYYEKLVKDNNIAQADIDKYEILKNYTAHYYTYSLYDSTAYQPFNADVADETATGYDYKVNDWNETLAYLEVKDGKAYTIFADYATVDQSIELGKTDDSDEENPDEEEKSDANIWLLASSILLVVAMVFAMLAILVKDMLKKQRRNKVLGKNNYNHNKVNRYMRKLKINKEEIEEVDAPATDDGEPATETEVNEAEETVETEETVTETETVENVEENNDEKPEDGNE